MSKPSALPPSLNHSGEFYFHSGKIYPHSLGLSVAFRQWRAESHCRFLHGYSLQIELSFKSETLDERNWVVDFGGLKSLKGIFEDNFDHKTLIAEDDPHLAEFKLLHAKGIIDLNVVPHCGMEALAYMIFEVTEQWLKDSGHPYVELAEVKVKEHDTNWAAVTRKSTT